MGTLHNVTQLRPFVLSGDGGFLPILSGCETKLEKIQGEHTENENRSLRVPAGIQVTVILLLTCLIGCSQTANPTNFKTGVSFGVHSVADAPNEDTVALLDPTTTSKVYVMKQALVTESDIRSVEITEDNGVTSLLVTLNPIGSGKMSSATSSTGQKLAIVVNGRIASVPKVNSRISHKFKISGSFSRSNWEELVE